ncbi:MAG: hypothetical protein ACLGJC_21730 [Alphaproteobacteria bacterium]
MAIAQPHAAQQILRLIQRFHDAQCGVGVHRRPHFLFADPGIRGAARHMALTLTTTTRHEVEDIWSHGDKKERLFIRYFQLIESFLFNQSV